MIKAYQLNSLRAGSEEVRGLTDEVHGVVLSPDAVQNEDRLVDLKVAIADLLGGLHGHAAISVGHLDLLGLLARVFRV